MARKLLSLLLAAALCLSAPALRLRWGLVSRAEPAASLPFSAADATLSDLPASQEGTVSFTDSAGRKAEVPAGITRIAPLGGTAQIILFALAPEYFVGLATPWPREAEEFLGGYYGLPVFGQMYGSGDLNLEQLAALDPQVLIDVGEAKSGIAEDMDDLQDMLGIPAVHVEAHLDSFPDAYRKLGALLGLEARGEALAAYCEAVNAGVGSVLAQVCEEDRVRMLYILGSDGMSVIAKGTYHGEIVDMFCDNLAVLAEPSSKGTGNPVDMEQILLWNPDVILFAPGSVYEKVASDPLWNELDAVRNGRYAEVPLGPYNWMGFPPAVQQYLGILWMCGLFYPDVAGIDLYAEVAAYFDLFYHTELTREQFDRLTARAGW